MAETKVLGKSSRLSLEDASRLHNAGVNAGHRAAQLKAVGYSAVEMHDAGFTTSEVAHAGFSTVELREAGMGPRRASSRAAAVACCSCS